MISVALEQTMKTQLFALLVGLAVTSVGALAHEQVGIGEDLLCA